MPVSLVPQAAQAQQQFTQGLGLTPERQALLEALVNLLPVPGAGGTGMAAGMVPTPGPRPEGAAEALPFLSGLAGLAPLLMGKGRARETYGPGVVEALKRMLSSRSIGREAQDVAELGRTLQGQPVTETLRDMVGERGYQEPRQPQELPAGGAFKPGTVLPDDFVAPVHLNLSDMPFAVRFEGSKALEGPASGLAFGRMQAGSPDLPALVVGRPLTAFRDERGNMGTQQWFVLPGQGTHQVVRKLDQTYGGPGRETQSSLELVSHHATLGEALAAARYYRMAEQARLLQDPQAHGTWETPRLRGIGMPTALFDQADPRQWQRPGG